MSVDIDFNNLEQYKIAYNPYNKDLELYDDVELYFYKSLIRVTKLDYKSVSLNEYSYQNIMCRLIMYSLFDWYSLHKNNEIPLVEFIDWFRMDYRYSRYLVLIYLHQFLLKQKMIKYEVEGFMSDDIVKEIEKEKLKENSIMRFQTNFVFNESDFMISHLSPKKFKAKAIVIQNSIVLLNGFIFNVYDVDMKTNMSIFELSRMKPNMRLKKMIKLNRNFFRIKENFEKNKWLI